VGATEGGCATTGAAKLRGVVATRMAGEPRGGCSLVLLSLALSPLRRFLSKTSNDLSKSFHSTLLFPSPELLKLEADLFSFSIAD